MMDPIKIGLLGLGHVGSSTANVLLRNTNEIARRAGRAIEVAAAGVRNLDKKRLCATDHFRLTDDLESVVNDPDIDIIVELLGGIEPSRSLVLQALKNGKQVVTANKALIAEAGNEIFALAHEHGAIVTFEAAVAGGIPIIKAVREGLAANQIESVTGIINGTSNFILTQMLDKGYCFADALKIAQEKGYAEADPSFDIEGYDVAHKITILAAIAFGIPLQFDKVTVEGISHITREDIIYAQEFGFRIKHLGIARKTEAGIELRVHPTFVRDKRLLASVNGVMNAILVQGDTVGPTIYYGAGAGGDATASAVVADLVDVVRSMTVDPDNRVPHLAFQPDAIADIPIVPMAELNSAYYLRLQVEDSAGVLAEITQILATREISIEAFLQKEPVGGSQYVPVVILTHRAKEAHVQKAIKELACLPCVNGDVTLVRLDT